MNAFSRMTVAGKPTWGIGLLVFLMLLSGVLAYLALSGVTGRMSDINTDKVAAIKSASNFADEDWVEF